MNYLKIGILLFLLMLTFYYSVSEKVTKNNGFGWDGDYYAYLVSNIYNDLFSQKIDNYYIRRILPPLLVSLPTKFFDIPITRDYIVYAFVTANLLCIFVSVILWLKICKMFQMSTTRTTVSLILLFGFYWIVKGAAFYPVLTDIFAFCGAIAMLYCYLTSRTFWLAFVVVLNFFVWPSTVYMGTFLLMFPKESSFTIAPNFVHKMSRFLCICILAGFGGLYSILMLYQNYPTIQFSLLSLLSKVIGSVLAMVYIYLCIVYVMENFKGPSKLFRIYNTKLRYLIICVFIIGGCLMLQYYLAPIKVETGLTALGLVRGSILKPLVFLVSDITYYGAGAVLCIVFFKPMLKRIFDLGLGAYLTVVFSLVLNMYPEPRFILTGFPLFVLGISLCGHFDRLSSKQWGLLIGTQILFSKIWLPIGAAVEDWENLIGFPAQFYFLNFGPWMAKSSYFIQLFLAVIIVMLFYHIFHLPSGSCSRIEMRDMPFSNKLPTENNTTPL